jgi:rhodanese-related sulfurtransferase
VSLTAHDLINAAKSRIREVGPEELLAIHGGGAPIVDVREPDERPVVLYCLSGGRSALAAEALQRLGFMAPLSLAGGILGWADAGHPVALP